MSLSTLRKTVVDALGSRAVHAVEDGLTVGVCVGLAVTVPTVAAVILTILGGTPARAGPMAIISEVYDLVRQDDARAQESYFVLAILAGLVIGAPLGSVLAPILPAVPIPA